MPNSTLDLSQLALDRTTIRGTRRRKRVFSRFVIPAAILVGFVGLIGYAARNQLLPRLDVTTIPVIVKQGESQATGTVLFQSAGWIEPSPTSTNVTALTSGIIDELLVVEGQCVVKGDPIARLNTMDAEFAVKHADAELANTEGDLQQANAELFSARTRLENPVHLQVQISDAESELAISSTELAKLPFLIEASAGQREFARVNLESKRAAGSSIPEVVLLRAESDFATSETALRELQKREPNLQTEVAALRSKLNALQSQRKLLVAETREFQVAEGRLHSVKAQKEQAQLRCDQAKLALERTVIRAPISGCILRLVATPGTQITIDGNSSSQMPGTVAEMYDPARLQVRADVRLEKVPLVQPGQLVEIETASARQVIHGHVLQINSSANIQKNTLEVKVQLHDPPLSVRPEMLVTATFLAPEIAADPNSPEQSTQRCFVPQSMIQTDANGSFVWIVDRNNKAQRRTVQPGKHSDGILIEITSGLNPGDKLIASDPGRLRENAAVRITGEELSIGVGDNFQMKSMETPDVENQKSNPAIQK